MGLNRVVPEWVKEITESAIGPAPFGVGDTVLHPDGRRVRITAGCYWAPGGFSNHWTWREVLADGLLGTEESGYGWQRPPSSASLH